MCGMCPDYVDECLECGFITTGRDGTPRRKARQFFLGEDKWCVHLTAEHGTDNPGRYYHFRYAHTGPTCECILDGWWPGMPDLIIKEDGE